MLPLGSASLNDGQAIPASVVLNNLPYKSRKNFLVQCKMVIIQE